MRSKTIKFLFFSVTVFSAGSFISVLSQSPWNIILILLLTFPIFFYVLDYVVSQESFFSRLLNITLFWEYIFIWIFLFFGLSWVSSAFHYKIRVRGPKGIKYFWASSFINPCFNSGMAIYRIFLGARLTEIYRSSPWNSGWGIH